MWRKSDGLCTRSAGLSKSARRRVREADVIWADAILVMEEDHKERLIRDFRDALGMTPVHVLDVPDEYRFMDPRLVDALDAAVSPLLETLNARFDP